jgi:hypothetical protein
MLRHEPHEDRHGVRRRHGVGIRDDHELTGSLGDAPVDVGRESARPVVLEQASSVRQLPIEGQIGDHHELVDLRLKGRHAALEIGVGFMRDDDAGDAHSSSS